MMNNMFGLDSIPPMRARRKQEKRNPVLSKRHSQCFVCVCARGRACVVRLFDVNAGRHPKIVLPGGGRCWWGPICGEDGADAMMMVRQPARHETTARAFFCCCSAVRRVSLWRGQRGIVKGKNERKSSSRLGAKKKRLLCGCRSGWRISDRPDFRGSLSLCWSDGSEE